MSSVESFLIGIRRRLVFHQGLRLAMWVLIALGLVVAGVAVGFLLQGLAVRPAVYWWGLVAGILTVGLVFVVSKASTEKAQRLADDYFDLKDGVTSARRFASESREGGMYTLQRRQIETALEEVRPQEMRLPFPSLLAVGLAFVGLSVLITGILPPLASKVAERAAEAETLAKSEDLKAGLEEALDALEREITDPEERALLQEANLREMLKDLQETTDLKDAMRQYAALERRVAQSSERLEQRRDEQLLARAGDELFKEMEHRKLGDQLKTQKYKDAAKRLKELQLQRPDASGKNSLGEKRERLKKLKSATQRMAAASRSGQRKRSNQKPGEEMSEELAKLLEKLDELASKLGLAMDDADLDEQEGSGKSMTPEELKKLLEQLEQLDQNMDQLGSKLREMDAKKKLQGKLKMLGMRLSKAQGYLAGNLNSPFASPGGQKPGEGSSESRRKERDALVDNGQNTQLKGIKGIGPSQTQIEEANEGSAISSRQAEDVERSFAKQLEAFVQREDVPEDVKDGVRDYFTKIHQPEDKTNEITN